MRTEVTELAAAEGGNRGGSSKSALPQSATLAQSPPPPQPLAVTAPPPPHTHAHGMGEEADMATHSSSNDGGTSI